MSDKKISKSTLKEAKEQFEEIQKFALEEATKNLKEDVSKKVIELMNSTLEDEALNEEITIDADGTKIIIDDNGEIKLSPNGQSTEHVFSSEVIHFPLNFWHVCIEGHPHCSHLSTREPT